MRDHALVADDVLDATDEARFSMDEVRFRNFYGLTAHRLRAYLTRISGDPSLADDVAQEAYCRLLQATLPNMDADGQRRYLFRIATNLLHDHHRRVKREVGPIDEDTAPVEDRVEEQFHLSGDMGRVFGDLKPRQRELLWLAYVEGMSHAEIAAVLGLSVLSIRPLLFRARRRMAGLLRARGLGPEATSMVRP